MKRPPPASMRRGDRTPHSLSWFPCLLPALLHLLPGRLLLLLRLSAAWHTPFVESQGLVESQSPLSERLYANVLAPRPCIGPAPFQHCTAGHNTGKSAPDLGLQKTRRASSMCDASCFHAALQHVMYYPAIAAAGTPGAEMEQTMNAVESHSSGTRSCLTRCCCPPKKTCLWEDSLWP